MSTLSVRLDGVATSPTDVTSRVPTWLDITRLVTALRFKSVDPGGFASVQVNLARPLDASLLAAFSDLLIFDTELGVQVGGGRLLEQGRDASSVWQLVALGEGLASMQDSETPYVLIDSSLSSWDTRRRTTRRLSAGTGRHPNNEDVDGLMLEATEDKGIAQGATLEMVTRVLDVCDQYLGGLSFRHADGASTNAWDVRWGVFSGDLSLGTNNLRAEDWSASTTARARIRYGSEFSSLRSVPAISWVRTAAAANASENTWSLVRDPIVQAAILDRNREYRTGSFYSTDYLLLHEIFVDVVARFCPRLDLVGAVVDGTPAHRFDQLVWIDGITPMAVMDECIEAEPAYTWAVWEKLSTGKWRTEFRARPTSVRYEIVAHDGFSGPAPFSEVYNRVVVRGRGPTGRELSTVRTSSVPALTVERITRTATLDLGDEVYSTATAIKRGDAFLAAHAAPPNAGTVTVGRRVLDNVTGRWIKPYEIRPGYLCRVRGVQASQDASNQQAGRGSTVFAIVSNEYDDVAGVSSLELDAYTMTERRAIAARARRRNRKR